MRLFAAAHVAEQLGKDDVRRARTDAAKAIYEDVCTRMRPEDYCASFVRQTTSDRF